MFSEKHFPGFFDALQACYLDWSEPEVCRLIGELNFVKIQGIVQAQKRQHHDLQQQSATKTGDCPNIPLLRDGSHMLLSEVIDTEQITAICTFQVPYMSSASAKSKKSSRRRGKHRSIRAQPPSQKPSASARNVLLQPLDEDADETEEDSTAEDIFDESSGAGGLGEVGGIGKKHREEAANRGRRERYTDEVDALFALAHSDQNPFSVRFACCEGLLSHGHSREAFMLARELAKELLQSPPNVLSSSTNSATQEEKLEGKDGRSSRPKPSCRHNKRNYNCDSCKFAHSAGSIRHAVPHPRLLENSELVAITFGRTIHLVKILTNSSEAMATELRSSSNSLALELALKVMRNPRGPAATRSLEVLVYHLEYELFSLLHKIEINMTELGLIREVARSYVSSLKSTPVNRIIVPPTIMAHYILDALSYSYQTNHDGSAGTSRRSAFVPSPPSHPSIAAHRRPSDDVLALEFALEVLGIRVFISEADHPMLCESIRRQRAELTMTLLLRNRDCLQKLGVILDKLLDSAVHRMYDEHTSNAIFFLSHKESQAKQRVKNQHQDSDAPSCSSSTTRKPSSERLMKSETLEEELENVVEQTTIEEEQLSSTSTNNGKVVHRRQTQESISSSNTTTVEGSREEDSSPRLSESGSSGVGFFNDRQTVGSTDQKRLECFINHHQTHTNGPHFQFLSNQATEAQVHCMMEFAKRLLTEAGGNQSNTMFNPLHNMGVQNNAGGPHRHLHICSFLIGLYALGLSNKVSANWCTRTYSTHVSWIQAQALEIGRSALEIIQRTWDEHLTPTEVASLADKASQSADPAVVEEAALLALSVLPKASSLSAVESSKALNQCKEQSSKLLEEACLGVEKAAEKDGVCPEVLFKVANHWYNLHCEANQQKTMASNHQQTSAMVQYNVPPPFFCQPPPQCQYHHQRVPPTRFVAPSTMLTTGIPSTTAIVHQMSSEATGSSSSSATTQINNNNNHRLHVSHSAPNLQPGVVGAPLSFMPPPNKQWGGNQQQQQQRHYPGVIMQQQQAPIRGSVPVPPPYEMMSIYGIPPPPAPARGFAPMFHPQQHQVMPAPHPTGIPMNVCVGTGFPHFPPPQSGSHHRQQPIPVQSGYHHTTQPGQPYHQQQQHMMLNNTPASSSSLANDPQKCFLINAHRVGMRAMDTMGMGKSEEGSWVIKYSEYSKNPSFCDEIRWLFEEVSVQLGVGYVHTFCEKVAVCIVSPFLLLYLLKESLKYFQQHQPPGQQQPFSPFHHPHHINPMPTFNTPPITPNNIGLSTTNNPSGTLLCAARPKVNPRGGGHQPAGTNCPYGINQATGAITINLEAVKTIAAQAKNVMLQHLFPYSTAELMRQCVEMSYMAASVKLNYPRFGDPDIDDICELVLLAREAFGIIPQNTGKPMFDTFLRFARKQKMYKKDVAQKITSCLQN